MAEVSSITKVNFFRGYGIYTSGAYAERLIASGAIKSYVIADIVNRQDDLLCSKGVEFNSEVNTVLQDQHLKIPFDLCVSISNPLSGIELEIDLQQITHSQFFLSTLSDRYQLLPFIAVQCEKLPKHPLLQQKLTVMKSVENLLYRRTLYTSILAVMIVREMRLPAVECERIFYAALYHDIGLLHISPLLLEEGRVLGAADLLQLHAHVRVAQALMVLEGVVDVGVIDAVVEHQERCDGTGYPNGKLESETGLLGQILALADSAVAIYLKRMQPAGRGWHDVAGVINLSRQSYLFRAVDILQSLIRQSELPVSNVVSGADKFGFSERVMTQCSLLQQWFEILRFHLMAVGFVHGDRHLHALQNSVLHIAIAYKQVLHTENAVTSDPSGELSDTFSEFDIEPLYLMAQELAYHVRRLTQLLQSYLAENKSSDPEINSVLERCFSLVKEYLTQE